MVERKKVHGEWVLNTWKKNEKEAIYKALNKVPVVRDQVWGDYWAAVKTEFERIMGVALIWNRTWEAIRKRIRIDDSRCRALLDAKIEGAQR